MRFAVCKQYCGRELFARAVAFVFNDGNNGDFVARLCEHLLCRLFLYLVAVNNDELWERTFRMSQTAADYFLQAGNFVL